MSPDAGPPVACIEMSSILYNVLKLKKASKFKKYFERSLLYSFLTKLCKPQAYRQGLRYVELIILFQSFFFCP